MLDPIYKFRFESYGVVCEISSNDEQLLESAVSVANRSLLKNLRSSRRTPDSRIELIRTGRSYYRMKRDGEEIASGRHRAKFLKFFDSIIRVTVAEFAPDLVFIHAGAVAWKGKGIIIPADSFKGKSTLVKEFVNAGATYFSDDFALLNKDGLLLPFARDISMRTDDGSFRPFEISLNESMIDVGKSPIPVDAVVFTEYKERAKFAPVQLTYGECVLDMIRFSLSFQRSPNRTLETMNRMAAATRHRLRGTRGDAKKTVKYLSELVDK